MLKEKDRPRQLLTALGTIRFERDYYYTKKRNYYESPLDTGIKDSSLKSHFITCYVLGVATGRHLCFSPKEAERDTNPSGKGFPIKIKHGFLYPTFTADVHIDMAAKRIKHDVASHSIPSATRTFG